MKKPKWYTPVATRQRDHGENMFWWLVYMWVNEGDHHLWDSSIQRLI